MELRGDLRKGISASSEISIWSEINAVGLALPLVRSIAWLLDPWIGLSTSTVIRLRLRLPAILESEGRFIGINGTEELSADEFRLICRGAGLFLRVLARSIVAPWKASL